MNATAFAFDESTAAVHAPAVSRRSYYPGLDGLRGIAILAVFASHFSGGHKSANSLVRGVAAVLDAGWIGVDLFFVLSGFLITGILLDTADTSRRARNFYARRSLRIFPVFYGVLGCFLLLTPVLHLHWRPQHLLYFFYLSNMIPVFTPHQTPPGIGFDLVHLWSLAVEEQFYLIWPMVIWSVRDRRVLLRISAGVMVGALLLRIVLASKGVDPGIIYQLLATRADSLIAGSALALLLRGPSCQHLPVKPIGWLSGLGVIAVFGFDGNGLHNSTLMGTLGYSLLAVFCCCLVYLAQLEGGWVRTLADRPVLRFFGRYSYGLYIYHGVLLVFFVPWLLPLQQATHSAAIGGFLYVLTALGISLTIAIISYHVVEAPILRLKRHFV